MTKAERLPLSAQDLAFLLLRRKKETIAYDAYLRARQKLWVKLTEPSTT